MKRNERGFTLLELLVVVAIIGIIVAISIVNFIHALNRAKQTRSKADVHAISTAIESYQVDWNAYPPAAAFTLPPGLSIPTQTVGASLAKYVTPTYLKTLPLADGWSSWFLYSVSSNGIDYCIESVGSDGIKDPAPAFGPTTSFKADIILVDGAFVQFPEGGQFDK